MSEQQAADLARRLAKHPVKTPAQGAATTVWAAVDPDLQRMGGMCLENCRVAETSREGQIEGVMPHALALVARRRNTFALG